MVRSLQKQETTMIEALKESKWIRNFVMEQTLTLIHPMLCIHTHDTMGLSSVARNLDNIRDLSIYYIDNIIV